MPSRSDLKTISRSRSSRMVVVIHAPQRERSGRRLLSVVGWAVADIGLIFAKSLTGGQRRKARW